MHVQGTTPVAQSRRRHRALKSLAPSCVLDSDARQTHIDTHGSPSITDYRYVTVNTDVNSNCNISITLLYVMMKNVKKVVFHLCPINSYVARIVEQLGSAAGPTVV